MTHEKHCNCNNEHHHHDCECEHHHHEHDCDCLEHEHNNQSLFKIGSPCVLDPSKKCNGCKECLICDLDPDKICDNCGKCLDTYNTDEKGFVSVKIDKIITDISDDETSLEALYKQYGLDDEDEE